MFSNIYCKVLGLFLKDKIVGLWDVGSGENNILDIFYWVLGLLIHLWLTYLVYLLGYGIHFSFCFSLALIIVFSFRIQKYYFKVIENTIKKYCVSGISLSVIIYFSIVSLIGITIFSSDDGIRTIWLNNYGDLPFHLGLITNFAKNTDPLLVYPIFPVEPLSYYFLIDFWSACIWTSPYDFKILAIVFFVQWVTCWMIIYLAFAKMGYGYASYLILFGGGTYTVLVNQFVRILHGQSGAASLSHIYIGNSYPWTVFMSTIWIPQRASVMGAMILIVGLCSYYSREFNSNRTNLVVTKNAPRHFEGLVGILFSLSQLAHFYFAFVGIVLIGGEMFLKFLICKYERYVLLRKLIIFILVTIIFAFPFLLLMNGKQSVLTISYGWMPWEIANLKNRFIDNFLGSAVMWSVNGLCFIILLLLIYRKVRGSQLIIIGLLFVFFNLVQLSVWDWDTIKGFIALYTALVCIFTFNHRKNISSFVAIFFLCVPAVMECIIVLADGNTTAINTKAELYDASLIYQRTPNTIIVSDPVHNSIVTLAGRKMYLGYDGWLASHGVDTQDRSLISQNALSGTDYDKLLNDLDLPIYLYSRDRHQKLMTSGLTADHLVNGLTVLTSTN